MSWGHRNKADTALTLKEVAIQKGSRGGDNTAARMEHHTSLEESRRASWSRQCSAKVTIASTTTTIITTIVSSSVKWGSNTPSLTESWRGSSEIMYEKYLAP